MFTVLFNHKNMKCTLTYIRNDEPRKSEKINPKTGQPYTYYFCSLRCKEVTDKEGNELWINGFGNPITTAWEKQKLALEEGKEMQVEIEVYDEEYKGEMKKKFKILNEKERLEKENEEMKAKLAELEKGKATEETPKW